MTAGSSSPDRPRHGTCSRSGFGADRDLASVRHALRLLDPGPLLLLDPGLLLAFDPSPLLVLHFPGQADELMRDPGQGLDRAVTQAIRCAYEVTEQLLACSARSRTRWKSPDTISARRRCISDGVARCGVFLISHRQTRYTAIRWQTTEFHSTALFVCENKDSLSKSHMNRHCDSSYL